MLVPFDLNQSKIQELGVAQHVADWHRVRILKEIDDVRFSAMFYGNIDLTAEAMIKLKKLKLFSLLNPVFSTAGKVTSYDRIVEVFDLPASWYITAAEELWAYCKRNSLAFNWQNSIQQDALKVVFDEIENKNWVSYITRNPSKYPSAGPDSVGYCIINVLPTQTNGFNTPFVTPKRPQLLATDYETSIGKEFSVPVNYQTVPMLSDKMKYTGVESLTPMLAYVYRVDLQVDTVPEIIRCEAILGYVGAFVINAKVESNESKELFASAKIVNDVKTTAVSCFEPNYYLNYSGTAPASITLADSSGRTYSQAISKTLEGYYQWYQLRTVALPNGKSYTYPWKNYPYVVSGKTYYSLSAYDGSNLFNLRKKDFYDKNVAQFSFPPYYPNAIAFGDLRVRNGLLYSDATSLYELQFIQFPDSIIDLLENLIYLQESVAALRSDIGSKIIYSRRVVISTSPYVDETRWFSKDDDGSEFPFLHPVSQGPIGAYEYLAELQLESVVAWGKAMTEIDAFLKSYKDKNDYAFNQAYQRYLQGQAIISGPAALAEFERKMKTGIFYYENGYEYWRAFTALEMALVEDFKKNAQSSAGIFAQNEAIRAQNKVYQDQVNAEVIMANSVLMSDAEFIAKNELKTIADTELEKIPTPTYEYLLQRATMEGGLPSDALQKWVNENPNWYLRPDVKVAVETLLAKVTLMEQNIATALVADKVSEIAFTNALLELFNIKV